MRGRVGEGRSIECDGNGGARWPAVMTLEDRRMLSTFTVTCDADSVPATSPPRTRCDGRSSKRTRRRQRALSKSNWVRRPQTITLAQGPLTLTNTYATTIYDGPARGR